MVCSMSAVAAGVVLLQPSPARLLELVVVLWCYVKTDCCLVHVCCGCHGSKV